MVDIENTIFSIFLIGGVRKENPLKQGLRLLDVGQDTFAFYNSKKRESIKTRLETSVCGQEYAQ